MDHLDAKKLLDSNFSKAVSLVKNHIHQLHDGNYVLSKDSQINDYEKYMFDKEIFTKKVSSSEFVDAACSGHYVLKI